jgi:hypothetical protein
MWGVIGAVVASIAMLFITQFLADNKAGSDALTDDMIKSIIKSELEAALQVDINGETFTYGQALSRIDHNLTVVQQSLANLSEE